MDIKMNISGSRFMKTIRYGIVLAAVMLLAACGGSSSGSFQSGGSARMSIQTGDSEVETGESTTVTVSFQNSDKTPVKNGTTVTLTSSDPRIGLVAAMSDDSDGEVGGGTEAGASAQATTNGGKAYFMFSGGTNAGTVTLTASANNPAGSGSVTATAGIEVVQGRGIKPGLDIKGARTMPANKDGVDPFLGSPFVNELTINYRKPDGSPGLVEDDVVQVAVSPVNYGAFSTLDDPSTVENEFFQLIGSGPVVMQAGVATVFIHSFDRAGTLKVSAIAVDEESGEEFAAEFEIEIEDGAADYLPANVELRASTDPVYITGSGAPSSKSLTVEVFDGGGNPVADPEGSGASYNNVVLTLDAPEGSGATLTGKGAEGTVSGREISVQTVNGVASFALKAGSKTGTHYIKAVTDRADNNVDNDLADPLSAETTVEVGDGQLFSLALVSPNFSAIRVNRVARGIVTDEEPEVDPETGVVLPPDPDGTYSLLMTVQASDKVGNPVLSNTQLNFGKIDDPLTYESPSFFAFSGALGDPEEGGRLFTIADEDIHFLHDPDLVDEAVEPGDTLVTFGHLVEGNRQHQAVRFVDSVIDDKNVAVTRDFNKNNQTGAIVDDGAQIPWTIGRSRIGTVDAAGRLDEDGRTSVRLTYPINAIGRPIVAWTQGTTANTGDDELTVAAVESMVFPAVSPLVLTVTPNQIGGNQETTVTICLRDGIGAPVTNQLISAAVSGGAPSSAISLDGVPLSETGTTRNATGSNGCVNALLGSQGLVSDQDDVEVIFFVGDAHDTVTIIPPGGQVLSVSPSRFVDMFQGPTPVKLNLRLTESNGEPVPGVEISGSCEAEGLFLSLRPGMTDDEGMTTAQVTVDLFDCDDAKTGEFTCEFTTKSGTPVGVFTAIGLSKDDLDNVSPACP